MGFVGSQVNRFPNLPPLLLFPGIFPWYFFFMSFPSSVLHPYCFFPSRSDKVTRTCKGAQKVWPHFAVFSPTFSALLPASAWCCRKALGRTLRIPQLPFGINSCLISTQTDLWLGQCGRASPHFLEGEYKHNIFVMHLHPRCDCAHCRQWLVVQCSLYPKMDPVSPVLPKTVPSTTLHWNLASRNPEFVPKQVQIV